MQFSDRHGAVLSADHIARTILVYEAAVPRNFLEVHVSRLRKKLGRAEAGELIEMVRGVGYVIR